MIEALLLHSVADRGIPHKERVALFATEDVSIAQFALTLGVSSSGGADARPIADNFLWLGSGNLKKGDWLLVYTGPGIRRVDPWEQNRVHSIYWGRNQTVFYNPQIVPILFQLVDVTILPPPHPGEPLPQLASISLSE